MSTTQKRPAPLTPNGRPTKRLATSSPEEGEVDDSTPALVAPPTPPPASPPSNKTTTRVKFPFKTKSIVKEDVERGRVDPRGSSIYERSREDDLRLREHESKRRRAEHERPGPRGPDSYRPLGRDSRYERSYDYHRSNHYEPMRERSPRRERQHSDDRHRSRDERQYTHPVSPKKESHDGDSSRTPLSRQSPSSPSPTSPRGKHRLPRPRSPAAYSPLPRDAMYDHDRYYEDRRQTAFRDPRGQYQREELDDYDRYRRSDTHYHEDRHRDYRDSRPLSPSFSSPRLRIASRLPSAHPLPPTEPGRTPPGPPPPLPPPSGRLDQKDQIIAPIVSQPLITPMDPPPSQPVHETVAGSVASEPVGDKSKHTNDLPTSPVKVKRPRAIVKRSRDDEKNAYGRVFVGCGQKDDYDVMTKLGEGTFGEVHKAVHKVTKTSVAIKRILMHNEKEGMPVTALREIKILKALKHPCIVELLDMFVVPSTGKDSPMSVYMVFPYMDHDLAGLLENERVKLQYSHIKLYMKQLLEGTEYMHHNNILHRDMKAANLLISNNGSLRIADFGLARAFDPTITTKAGKMRRGHERKYTNCVVTRWYRPPELLLGAKQYGGEIDMWGIGCVLGEMFFRRPILPGNSDLDQLEKIWQLCGSPNQQNWPHYDLLPGCEGQIRFNQYPRRVKVVYDSIGKETCDLLDKLLTLDPRMRITATEALDHEYFWTDPLPADPKTLPIYESSHEFDQRGRRNQNHQHMPHGPPGAHRPIDSHRPPPGLPPPLHTRHSHQPQQHQQYRNGPPAFPPSHMHQHQLPPPMHLLQPARNPNNWPGPGPHNPYRNGGGSDGPSPPGPPRDRYHGAPPGDLPTHLPPRPPAPGLPPRPTHVLPAPRGTRGPPPQRGGGGAPPEGLNYG